MASNEDVAKKFAKVSVLAYTKGWDAVAPHLAKLTGSNLRIQVLDKNDRELHFANSGYIFKPVMSVYSYRTEVGRAIHNTSTDKLELWLDERRYSPTTSRHVQLIRRAFNTMLVDSKICVNLLDTQNQLFYVGYLDARVNTYEFSKKRGLILGAIAEAQSQRIHMLTRQLALNKADQIAKALLRNLTAGVPLGHPLDVATKREKGELINYSGFLNKALEYSKKATIDELKAMLRGFLELELN
jgi:hypothetical protein